MRSFVRLPSGSWEIENGELRMENCETVAVSIWLRALCVKVFVAAFPAKSVWLIMCLQPEKRKRTSLLSANTLLAFGIRRMPRGMHERLRGLRNMMRWVRLILNEGCLLHAQVLRSEKATSKRHGISQRKETHTHQVLAACRRRK